MSKRIRRANWGFDLTEFKSSKDFQKILRENKLSKFKRDGGFVWKNKDLLIKTANNPITGEYYGGGRENEKGYASYIGISGKPRKVKKLVKNIRSSAVNIEGESPGKRDFI